MYIQYKTNTFNENRMTTSLPCLVKEACSILESSVPASVTRFGGNSIRMDSAMDMYMYYYQTTPSQNTTKCERPKAI